MRPAIAINPVLLISALLIVVVFAAYSPVKNNDFINFDDSEYVYANPHVNTGLTRDNILWAFSHFYAANWHPITWISHMVDCSLYGLRAGGHHLTSLYLHLANAVLLLLILKAMTGALWRPALVAALFALHPLHVESVAWIAERKDLLSTFFMLCAMWSYIRYCRKGSVHGYAGALICFALGLMCKPMIVTLPCILLLLDYWPSGRISRVRGGRADNDSISVGKAILEKAPFLALSVIASIVTYLAQRGAEAVAAYPLSARLSNVAFAYVKYLIKTAWPGNLAFYYPFSANIPPDKVIIPIIVLVAISAVAVYYRKRAPWLLMGWLWYLGMLVPVIGIIQVGAQSMADRYTYLPLVGIFIIISWGLESIRAKFPSGIAAGIIISGIAFSLAACTMATRKQVGYWKNNYTLYYHAIAATGLNHLAHNNLGSAFMSDNKPDSALYHFKKSIEIFPEYALGNYTTGLALGTLGRYDEAVPYFKNAIRIDSSYAIPHQGLGEAYEFLDQDSLALYHYRMAIRLNPDFGAPYYRIGAMLFSRGAIDSASIYLQRALALNPGISDAHYILGVCFMKKGLVSRATYHFDSALKLEPKSWELYNNIGYELFCNGMMSQALRCYTGAINLSPISAKPYINRGMAFSAIHDSIAAARDFARAIELEPSCDSIVWLLKNVR